MKFNVEHSLIGTAVFAFLFFDRCGNHNDCPAFSG